MVMTWSYRGILFLCIANSMLGCSHLEGYSVYLFGWVKHFDPKKETNDGNIEYLAISRELKKENWRFNTGAGTYVDSYNLRSYGIFSDISHERLRWKWVTPIVSMVCTYKGVEYGSDERRIKLGPMLKLRLGQDTGVFMTVTGMPKLEGLTDGFVMSEFGYRF